MKRFIALLAFFAISFVQATPTAEKMVEFVTGIVEGIEESGDINKLLPCTTAGDEILEEFKEAISCLHLRDPTEIMRGVFLFIEASTDLMTKLRSCMEGFTVLQELDDALLNIDPRKVFYRVITRFSEFIYDIQRASSFFNAEDYHGAGDSIGSLLRIMFLVSEEDEVRADKMQEFVAGILEGVNESGDINNLIPCIKSHDTILRRFRQALDHLSIRHPEELRRGLVMFIEASKELLDMLKDCMEKFPVLKKLAELLISPDYVRIINKILVHFAQFITDVTKAKTCFTEGHYHCAGESIGDILEFIFLTYEMEEPTAGKMQEFVAGILEGINEPGDINKLVPCIKADDTIFQKFRESLENLSLRHPDKLRKGLTMFFEASKLVLDMLKACMDDFPFLKKISGYLVNPDYMRIVNKIMFHFTQFITDVAKSRTCFTEGHYHCAGESIGDILEFIFLTY